MTRTAVLWARAEKARRQWACTRGLAARALSGGYSCLRAAEVARLLFLHGLRFAARYALAPMNRRSRARPELVGNSLCDLLEALGPTFIKLGQILSSRPDLLPAPVVVPLQRLQDEVTPLRPRVVRRCLEQAYGQLVEEVFEDFCSEPVAAASIAQVHRAELRDGRRVAVKVQRPRARHQIENDLKLLRGMARILSLLPPLRTAPLVEIVEDLGAPVTAQLDFLEEAESNRRFRRNFAHMEHVRFPRLVEELCNETVLVMEFMDDLHKVNAAVFTPEQRKVAALTGLRALYKMIFDDGFVHADLHSGNIFLRSWGEIVILDMGLVARLEDADQRDFVDFFFGLVNNDGTTCARIVYETAIFRGPGCDRAAFEQAMIELIAEHSALKSQDFEVTRFVYQLMELQRRFQIRGSTKFIMAVLSMVVFDGICKQLYPDCDFQREARGFLVVAKYRRTKRGRSVQL